MKNLDISEMWGLKPSVQFFSKKRNKFRDLYPGEKFIFKQIINDRLSILDFGCATGGLYKILKNKIKNLNYVGVDFNKNLLKQAKLLNPGIKFYSTDEYKKKLKNKKFDLVVILGLLHLNFDWKKILIENANFSKRYIIFDLRESHNKSIEKQTQSYFKMQFDSRKKIYKNFKIPYNIINSREVENFLNNKIKKFKKFIEIKYEGIPSKHTKTIYRKIIFANYCLKK